MINKKTVLVLGAGASKPYGLPLGTELRDSVIRAANNFAPYQKILGIEFTNNQYTEFTKTLAHSGFSSVDAFLEENSKWLEIGKAAIALELLKAEWKSINNLFPPKQPKDHWYETLWSHLKAPSWTAFKKNEISIITFNYDRSLEHYLITLLCNQYKIKPDIASKGLASLPFLHVHGHLGSYLNSKGENSFGNTITKEQFNIARSGIQIVHENEGDTPEFLMAQKSIREAERVLFIGFGYHPKNMAKLAIRLVREYNAGGIYKIFGTHKGIKSQAWNSICFNYGFTYSAVKQGAGSISDLISAWIN